ncbi:MAG: folylpolyglutamate synthase/dihydrofolate synthase family protein [Pseudomonadota bacterium]
MSESSLRRSDAILERLLGLHPKVIDLSLERLERLLAALDHPERAVPPVVHIAGTNGKGSTLAYLLAGLEASGNRVHAYTSPHLAFFHERIRLAGELISEAELSALLEECEAANAGAPITFFEITTAAAFLAYSRHAAEWCLLEVGLGGRLDATNVIDAPKLTVITPVSIDHQQFLGDTIAEIAAEKAGILKPGIPCVVGPQRPEALAVIEDKAREVGAPLQVHGQDWMVRTEHGRLVFEDEGGLLDLPAPALAGAHQSDNAGIAVAALRFLGQPDAICARAVTEAEWPARLQRLTSGPLAEAAIGRAELWLDGGHNKAAAIAIGDHFGALEERNSAPLVLICGMINTKDPAGFLEPFRDLARHLYAVPIPGEPNALPPEALVQAATGVGLMASEAETIETALRDALADLTHPRVLICGSLYLAGSVLRRD